MTARPPEFAARWCPADLATDMGWLTVSSGGRRFPDRLGCMGNATLDEVRKIGDSIEQLALGHPVADP